MIDGVLKLGHFDDLDTDIKICWVFFTAVNCAAVSRADIFSGQVAVALNGLDHIFLDKIECYFVIILTAIIMSTL